MPGFFDDPDLTYRMSLLPFGTYADPNGGPDHLGFAVPGMISEPINALYRLAQNSVDENGHIAIPNPENPQNREDVLTGVLSLYGGNALNPLTTLPENAVGMFAGRMAKTADHAALARAEDLAAKGAPRDQIWQQTGWFQGPDGKWRFEVDDSRAFVKGAALKNADQVAGRFGDTVGSALFHPDLHEAYPHFSDVGFGGKEGRGAYYERDPLYGDRIAVGNDYRGSQMENVLLHEIQHGVQYKEGFTPGAATSSMSPDDYKRVAGEVEARNVQKRMDMTPEERRATPPWLTQDVPDEDQIIRFLSDTGRPSLMGSAVAGMQEAAPIRTYHGTNSDFPRFNTPSVWSSSYPEVASEFAGYNPEGGRILPLDLYPNKLMTFDEVENIRRQRGTDPSLAEREIEDIAKERGYDTIDWGGGHFQSLTPGTVRSATTGETLFSGAPPLPATNQNPDDPLHNYLLTF